MNTLAGVLRATHLFPNIMVGLATLLFGFLATGGQPDGWALARTWLVVMCGHAAIGLLNDYHDRNRDALTQPDKPIPSGQVSPDLVAGLTIALLAIQVALYFTLPPGAALLAFAATASGLLYDLRLKDTYLSWLPYFISFSTYPLFLWAALGRFEPLLLWLYPPALLLTIGINLANALPDIEPDFSRHLSRGLAHRLGTRNARLVGWLLFTLAPLLCLGLSRVLPVNRGWIEPLAIIALGVMLVNVLLFRRLPRPQALELTWKLGCLSTLCTAAGWLAAISGG
jgi:4-hydroxybenzoate polyprenyltransferase